MPKKIGLPVSDDVARDLRAGDNVLLSGVLYVARDSAHKRMVEAMDKGEPLPFDIRGQALYYMGPTPAKAGQIIGSAGPTTSGRMDAYSPRLIAAGLKAMIGKGSRSEAVKAAMKRYGAVYLATTGGAGALISRTVRKSEVVAYPELGAEAILRLEVEDFPATVVNDVHGGDLYQEARAKYRLPHPPAG